MYSSLSGRGRSTYVSVLEIFLGLSADKCTTNMQSVAILMSKIYSAFIYVTMYVCMYSVAKTEKQRVLPKIKSSSAAGRVFKGKTKNWVDVQFIEVPCVHKDFFVQSKRYKGILYACMYARQINTFPFVLIMTFVHML